MVVNKNYDAIVVGAGNAALCAAISATESGLNVLVLEKGPIRKRGGNSYFTDGAIRFAYDNKNDIREIMPHMSDEEANACYLPSYKEEEFFEDLMRVTGNKSDLKLAKQLVSKSYETIKWMKDQGVEFELSYENQSFEKDGINHFWGGLPVKTKNKGVGLIGQLMSRIEELGIEIWYESQATQLIKENGEIKGIKVRRNDEEIVLNSSSVILACGSFEANKKWRMENLGEEWGAAIVRGSEFNTGDGIAMAVNVGAQKYGEWDGCHSIGTDLNAPKVGDFEKPGDIFKKHSYPLGIIVNKEGKRFLDEGADFRNYTYAKYGREVLKQPDHVAYQVYDSKVRPMLRKEYNLEEATFFEANNLDELSKFMDIDKEKFLETISEYNSAVQKGDYNPTIKDGKSTKGIYPPKSNWALTIEEGPFYCFPITCGITFAFGGLKVSTVGQVLDEKDNPISGLFAAGEMVGGIFYRNYPGGSGLMSGAVFGKLAGNSAAQYVEKKASTTV